MKSHPSQGKWPFVLVVLTLCTVLFVSCVEPNNPPVVSKLQPEKDLVSPSGESIVVCVASDVDDDHLSYTWSATGGDFSGVGSVITWTAPDTPGTYTITVKVADGKGGEASGQLSMDVLINQAPVIESLIAEPSVVNQGENAIIECIASDPDGDALAYKWAAAKGNISGQGATVTWTAPNICDDYIIKVTVSDTMGSETSEELKIEVKNPG